ncbi:hypothetical protein AGMMS50218_16560 [Actinomycetota bacterium]|nr:hypothetical protein AGMMS50218_16560 [Actinomycetota bacterium]
MTTPSTVRRSGRGSTGPGTCGAVGDVPGIGASLGSPGYEVRAIVSPEDEDPTGGVPEEVPRRPCGVPLVNHC